MSNLQSLVSNNFNQNPISGVFGNGNVRFFTASTTWTVPAGITRVRARVWGGGGNGPPGGGGGFAIETISSGLGATVVITVGAAGVGTAGGTSSFGAFVSATGGAIGAGAGGGTGSGGDINNTGGSAGTGTGGGGGAASLLGNGGEGGTSGAAGRSLASGGGAGTVTSTSDVRPGGSGFTSIGGVGGAYNATAMVQAPVAGIPLFTTFSIDFIGTGGGGGSSFGYGSQGINGGGGGSGASGGGNGGFPGGGGGSTSPAGGAGLVIVEW